MSSQSLNASGLVLKSSKGDVEVDIDDIMDNISIVLYTLTVVLGIPGNLMVIWVAGVKLKPKVTSVFLVNLAVADLIFCFTRISSLVKKLFFDHWPFGVFVCKFNGFFKYANMFCSVFLLAVISLDRALCVWRPVFMKRRRTVFAARAVALAVWTLALALSAPFFTFRQVYPGKNNLSKCSLDGPLEAGPLEAGPLEAGPLEAGPLEAGADGGVRRALYLLRFVCGFLLPFAVVLVCYVLTGVGIRRTRLKGKSRPLRILVTLVVAFFLCWAPYHCLLLVKMVDSENPVVKVWHPVASGVAYFNSCVNPILYYCVGLRGRGRFGYSLAGVYRRALAEDGDGATTQSADAATSQSLEDGSARRHSDDSRGRSEVHKL